MGTGVFYASFPECFTHLYTQRFFRIFRMAAWIWVRISETERKLSIQLVQMMIPDVRFGAALAATAESESLPHKSSKCGSFVPLSLLNPVIQPATESASSFFRQNPIIHFHVISQGLLANALIAASATKRKGAVKPEAGKPGIFIAIYYKHIWGALC